MRLLDGLRSSTGPRQVGMQKFFVFVIGIICLSIGFASE